MANTVTLKRSAVAGKAPLTTDLAAGELAINTYDGKLFIKRNRGTDEVVQIGAHAQDSAVVAVAASNIDCGAGNYFTKTATGALSWTVSNVPTGRAFSFILELTNGGAGVQTWFSGIKWPGGTAPTLVASGVDLLGFVTDDGGTIWRGVHLMKDSK